MADISSSASKAVKDIESNLTNRLREAAKDSGWPDKIVDSLSVSTKDDKISVVYPSRFNNKVEDLEYGNGSNPPLPVIRTFVEKNKDIIGSSIAMASLDFLFDSGILP